MTVDEYLVMYRDKKQRSQMLQDRGREFLDTKSIERFRECEQWIDSFITVLEDIQKTDRASRGPG